MKSSIKWFDKVWFGLADEWREEANFPFPQSHQLLIVSQEPVRAFLLHEGMFTSLIL